MLKKRWRVDVLERVEVLVGRLRDLAQHQPAARRAARDVPALLVGLGAVGDLEHERRSSRGEPRERARLEHRAEVVGVRDERVAVACVEQRRRAGRWSRARCRGRRGRAAPTPAPGSPGHSAGVKKTQLKSKQVCRGYALLNTMPDAAGAKVVIPLDDYAAKYKPDFPASPTG